MIGTGIVLLFRIRNRGCMDTHLEDPGTDPHQAVRSRFGASSNNVKISYSFDLSASKVAYQKLTDDLAVKLVSRASVAGPNPPGLVPFPRIRILAVLATTIQKNFVT